MKYYVVVGEASGDLQASYLIKEIHNADPQAEVRGFGGELMESAGATIVKHYKELAFMGAVVVLLNCRTIYKNIAICKRDIERFKPDVLILVDYPGFNLKIARWAKENNVKTYYYISPKIWAWNQKRVVKIKKMIDRMFVILPFEKEFYAKFDYPVDFVGHPLLDTIADWPKIEFTEFCNEHGLSNKPIIALLPGSRKQEITAMLSTMLSVVDEFPQYQFVIAGAPSQDMATYEPFLKKDVSIVENRTYDLLQHTTSALVVSGTATLETALFGVPQVVCYKTGWVFYNLAKLVIQIGRISLVNLIMDKELVKELIQGELTKANLVKELAKVTSGESREQILAGYQQLREKLGGEGASARAAKLIVESLRD